ncbi:hypothetical protein [Dehalobacter sp. TeCB1]|uniref:hypothetical protein n=1 Tax=Dehalobacter sp. TeCB1 TaxID=1843715 RepID=UPI000B21F8E1|nr:hypothetical protein [Dehalobacter sp. TeCB1]
MADSMFKAYYLLIFMKNKLLFFLRNRKRNPDYERGSSLISFLIVFGLWMMIFFAFFSMFFLNNMQGSMINAVNLGLERAAIVGGTTTEVQTLIRDQLAHTGVNVNSFTITGSGNDTNRISYGQYITITVSGPRNFTDWSSGHPVSASQTISVTKTIMSQYLP